MCVYNPLQTSRWVKNAAYQSLGALIAALGHDQVCVLSFLRNTQAIYLTSTRDFHELLHPSGFTTLSFFFACCVHMTSLKSNNAMFSCCRCMFFGKSRAGAVRSGAALHIDAEHCKTRRQRTCLQLCFQLPSRTVYNWRNPVARSSPYVLLLS